MMIVIGFNFGEFVFIVVIGYLVFVVVFDV